MTVLRIAVAWVARSPARAFILIFLLGLSIRVADLTTISARRILPNDRMEDTAIATALVERGEFADPYIIPSGPTAHLPPLVPGIHAFFWRVFGMGLAGGVAAFLFNIVALSALYALAPWLGEKLGLGREPGVLAGIVGSFVVLRFGNAEEATGLVLALLAVVFLRRWTTEQPPARRSFILGLACGIAFHLQPVLLSVVLGWMVFELWWRRTRRSWAMSGLVVLGMALACAPWAWRNHTVLHDAFFIRSNLGLELRMGNNDHATGDWEEMGRRGDYRHPRMHLDEAELVRDLGEAEYMRRAGREALEWIRAHPARFLALTASRFTQYWLGPIARPRTALAVTALTILALLGAWRSLPTMSPPQRAALMTPLLCYPLIYYVVGYMPRYRVALDWTLLLLAGAAVWRWLTPSPVPHSER